MHWRFLSARQRMKRDWRWIFVVALGIGGIVSLYASSAPDGLARVAEMQGFSDRGSQSLAAMIPNYAISGISNPVSAKSLAGMVGSGAVFAVLTLLGTVLSWSSPKRTAPPKRDDAQLF